MIRTLLSLVRPALILTLLAIPIAATADGSAVEKTRLLGATLSRNPFSPGDVNGQLDVVTLDLVFAVRKTDALNALQQASPMGDEKQFFIESSWIVLAPGGTAVATRERLDPILPPFTTQILDGQEHVVVQVIQSWDGRDGAGMPVPDGLYGTRLEARVIRINTPGHASMEAVTAPADVEPRVDLIAGGLRLDWEPVVIDVFGEPIAVEEYHVYRSTSPDFTPDTRLHSNRIARTPDPWVRDLEASATSSNLFYMVTAVDGAGRESSITAIRKVIDTIVPLDGQVGVDNAPPSIMASVDPAPNAAGWNNTDVTVSFDCQDATGIASCSGAVVVSAEGAGQQVTGTAEDLAGNTAMTTASINLDRTPPVLVVSSPAEGDPVPAGQVVVTGTATDGLSGVARVEVNGVAASLTGNDWTAAVPTPVTTIMARAHDLAGNMSGQDVNVTGEPATTIEGSVVDPAGTPVEGALLVTRSGLMGRSGADGSFSIAGERVVLGDVAVSAIATINAGSTLTNGGQVYGGFSATADPVPDGATPVGQIMLRPGCRGLVFSPNVVGADECLKAVLEIDPADQEANLFRAVTRLGRISEDQQVGPDPGASSDSLREMLDRLGLPADGRSLFSFTLMPPEVFPEDLPMSGEVQRFLGTVLYSEIKAAAEENLQKVQSGLSTVITADEFLSLGVSETGPVEVDFGDAKVLESMLRGLAGALGVSIAHDWNVDVTPLLDMDWVDFQREILDVYPAFLNLNPDGQAVLTDAKNLFTSSIDTYYAASDFIRNHDDLNQMDDIVAIAAEDLADEESLRVLLGEIRCSLEGHALTGLTETSAECSASAPPTIRGRIIDASRYFEPAFDLRRMLPALSFDATCGNYVTPVVPPASDAPFPDPTFNGILPGNTQQDVIDSLEIREQMAIMVTSKTVFFSRPGRSDLGLGAIANDTGKRGAPLVIQDLAFQNGSVFRFLGEFQPFVVCAREFVLFYIEFSPDVVGDYEDTLVLTTDDPVNPVVELDVFGSSLSFTSNQVEEGVPSGPRPSGITGGPSPPPR